MKNDEPTGGATGEVVEERNGVHFFFFFFFFLWLDLARLLLRITQLHPRMAHQWVWLELGPSWVVLTLPPPLVGGRRRRRVSHRV